ncbi:MAG TPA: hypothetical protein DCZ00_04500 [Lactococcus sp.]|nr:hypothetical protein [Lactococcus sp.]
MIESSINIQKKSLNRIIFMSTLVLILILMFCLGAYYFGANEFVVKPLISRRRRQNKKISKFFLLYAWGLGLIFLGLLFLTFYLEGIGKLLPSTALIIWIFFFYLKNT